MCIRLCTTGTDRSTRRNSGGICLNEPHQIQGLRRSTMRLPLRLRLRLDEWLRRIMDVMNYAWALALWKGDKISSNIGAWVAAKGIWAFWLWQHCL